MKHKYEIVKGIGNGPWSVFCDNGTVPLSEHSDEAQAKRAVERYKAADKRRNS